MRAERGAESAAPLCARMSGVLQHRYAPFGFAAVALVTEFVALTSAWLEVPQGKGVLELTLLDSSLEDTTARLPVLGAIGVGLLLNALALYNAYQVSFSLEIKRLSEVRKWLMFATAATVLALVVWFVLLDSTKTSLGLGGGGKKALDAANVAPTSGPATTAGSFGRLLKGKHAGSFGRLLQKKPVKGAAAGAAAAGGAAAVGSTALFGIFFDGQIYAGLSAISSGIGMLAAKAQLQGA